MNEADDRMCACGHPESIHHQSGQCVDPGPVGWDFCSCEQFKAVEP